MQVQCVVKMSIVLVSNGVGASFQNNVITFAKYTRQNLPYHIHIGLNVTVMSLILFLNVAKILLSEPTLLPDFLYLRSLHYAAQPSYPHSTEDYYCSQ